MAKRILPTAPEVPLELWRQLYLPAVEFQEEAPWRWMDDDHVLGIRSPSGLRLISAMGKMGEVFGLVSYRHNTGLSFIVRLLRGEFPPETSEAMYYQDALIADFVPRKELRKEDQRVIDELGFRPVCAKPQRFPKFSSYSPGYVPWFLNETEARILLEDLQKGVRFARLVSQEPTLFGSRRRDEYRFYPEPAAEPLSLDQFEWEVVSPVPPAADAVIEPEAAELAGILEHPRMEATTWELSVSYGPDSICEAPRPYYPKLALAVDGTSGFVLGYELGRATETMADTAVQCLKRAVLTCGGRPRIIKVNSVNLFRALEPVVTRLGAKLLQERSLPMANEARRSVEQYSRRR